MSSKGKSPAATGDGSALVPKLRFPEFRDAGEWVLNCLGELSDVVRGGSPRPIDGFLTTAADGLNWLKIGDVDRDAKYVTQTAEKVRLEALTKTRVVDPGDLILSNSMSFGRPYILKIKTCIHDGWIAITKIAEKADRDFLYYWISAPSSQSYFSDNAAGSGVQNLNADIIKALPVRLPSLLEQQKIADCLASADTLIGAQGRKVEALRAHKKGLMQQLFPQEGETQPRLRFPEFREAGEWEKAKLGNHVAIGSGDSPSNYTLSSTGKYALVKVEDLNNCTKYQITGREFCNDSVGAIPMNSIVFPKRGAAIELNKIRITAAEILIDTNLMALTPKNGLITEFLYYCIANVGLSHIADTSTIPQINNKHIIPFEFLLPTPPEQQRIADSLTSLDELIAAESQKRGTLQTHKNGLMQQLFPSVEDADA